jgi:hypothetical protein
VSSRVRVRMLRGVNILVICRHGNAGSEKNATALYNDFEPTNIAKVGLSVAKDIEL